jgi:N-acetylglucosamine kinase-like BadF-type ATPase
VGAELSPGAAGHALGIDVGGSGTRAVLVARDSAVVAVGRGPAGNHQGVGWDGTRAAIDAALQGMPLAEVQATHVGASGLDFPEDIAVLQGLLSHLPGLVVENDCLLGLHAATTDGVGGVVVAGSGTNAKAVGRDGQVVGVGGVGWHCGDVGGAAQLGLETLRLAIRSWEGREVASTLVRRCVELAGVDGAAQLLHDVGTWTGPDQLAAATVALQEASAGDPLARGLVGHFGREMGLAVGLALRGAGLAQEQPPVVLIGGLVAQSLALPGPVLLDALALEVARHVPGARIRPTDAPPVLGALAAALRRTGVDPDLHQLRARVEAA